MKFVGVSAPAWTIPGKRREPEEAPQGDPSGPIVDSDALSRKHLYKNAPGVVFVTPHVKSPPPEPAEAGVALPSA